MQVFSPIKAASRLWTKAINYLVVGITIIIAWATRNMKLYWRFDMAQVSAPSPDLLGAILSESAAAHHHLCPRQVLGVRLGLYGLRLQGFIGNDYHPRFKNIVKRLITIVEIDGCGADGVAVSTDCWVGKRTLQVANLGKVAATLVDTMSGRAVRVAPSLNARTLASEWAPDAESRWHAYLEAYQLIPDELLMTFQEVGLVNSIENIVSDPEALAICDSCGEEVFNAREVEERGRRICRTCAGEAYYRIQN